MNSEREAREQIADIGRRLYDKGFVAGTNGNLSVRFDADLIITTPRGACLGSLDPEALVPTSLRGEVLDGRPDSVIPVEYPMHLVAYIVRSDVQSVVHAHPATATGFAAAGLGMSDPVLTDLLLGFNGVPLAPYAAPGTVEFAQCMVPLLAQHDAVLLSNHGAVTLGSGSLDAFHKMDLLELVAKSMMTTRLLGGGRPLSAQQTSELRGILASLAAASRSGDCQSCSGGAGPTASPAGLAAKVNGEARCLGCGACSVGKH